MQDRTKSELIVYYVVAAVSIFVLISYGSTKDIPPIAGFLITGMAVYILYPNETIALIMALIVSAILRRTRREGFEMEEEEEEEEDEDLDPSSADENEKKKKKKKENYTNEPVKGKASATPTFNTPLTKTNTPVPKATATKEKSKAGFELNPANYNAPSSQDMDKLSGMIDKTMKLIEMLPDGFLQNASNNNTI